MYTYVELILHYTLFLVKWLEIILIKARIDLQLILDRATTKWRQYFQNVNIVSLSKTLYSSELARIAVMCMMT